jgi:hypothetical protein
MVREPPARCAGAPVKLAELERYFAAVATSTTGPPADLDEVFAGNVGRPASARLAVYNQAYHHRLLDALASVFTRTKQVLGHAEFERLALAYIARHPSEHPAIERVGRLFPSYLSALRSTPREVRDLAALEWARLCALVAPNPSALASAHSVDVVAFPQSRLHFVPALVTVSLDARVLPIFSGEGAAPAELAKSETCVIAVWRQHHAVRHEALGAIEFEALRLARTGASVARICALFDSGSEAEDIARAFGILSAWFARGWIERVVVAA